MNPEYGWDSLSITERSMRVLLHSMRVFTPFFKYVSAFGLKTFAQDEGYEAFDLSISRDPSSHVNFIGMQSFAPL